ncbi:hypothetical protein ACAG24_029515, partial [Mycobacterium sp. pW049]|uniref:hypothetical protein n=1 Tax=[Mycobacterium] bulgaricum TaxID=3238985 RepID=UPI0035A8DC85
EPLGRLSALSLRICHGVDDRINLRLGGRGLGRGRGWLRSRGLRRSPGTAWCFAVHLRVGISV